MRKINRDEYDKLLKFTPSVLRQAEAKQNSINHPITEEILLEALEKIENLKRNEEMQKLLRTFLKKIEENNIKEIVFFNDEFKRKDWVAIFII